MAGKIEVVKIETEADKRLNNKEAKKKIHDLYMKYYGGYDETD